MRGRIEACLSDDALLAMTDSETPPEQLFERHLEDCPACSQRYHDARGVEDRLRWEGRKVRLNTAISDLERIVQGALQRASGVRNFEEFAERGKNHLQVALAPVFGERLTSRSIHLASVASRKEDSTYSAEAEWNEFVDKLGDIFSTVCGATGKNAVLHVSRQVLAGAA